MLRQIIAMALLIDHVGPAIHLEGDEGGSQPAVDFSCPHFETLEIGSGGVTAAPVLFRLSHLAMLPGQSVYPQSPPLIQISFERNRPHRAISESSPHILASPCAERLQVIIVSGEYRVVAGVHCLFVLCSHRIAQGQGMVAEHQFTKFVRTRLDETVIRKCLEDSHAFTVSIRTVGPDNVLTLPA